MMLNKVSLNTIGLNRIGLNRIGKPSRGSSDRPYIDPEVLASLKAVCICYGKSNDDPDRAVVKNLVDPDNPFVISNASYTEGSGYADKGSPYYGAFVTDGINDLITSTKTVQEMLGGSNEITVISMIHQIDGNVNYTNGYTNYIRHGGGFIRNVVTGNNGKGFNKTGIYGYTSTQLGSSNMGLGNVINNILGDKEDYSFERSSTYTLDDAKYSVQNFINANNQPSNEGSSVAWYWTIIANKVLTTDEINQVIAYFNLDKYVKPDIYYDVKKQGLTNDNHAQFGDKLIDYSGNSRDLQLFNIGWNLGSGIGKYAEDFSTMKHDGIKGIVRTSSKIYLDKSFDCDKGFWLCYTNSPSPAYKVRVSGIPETGMLTYTGGIWVNLVNGINELPARTNTEENHGFVAQTPNVDWSKLVIEQIPDFADAICFDGVEDYGKVTGMPIYKDYTVIADYERLEIGYIGEAGTAAILSKSYTALQGAFLMNLIGNTGNHMNTYTFGNANSAVFNDLSRKIYYQSKYKMQGFDMTIGSGVDGDSLWLGVVRDNDSRFFNGAIYSLMSFPYSMSEFLIERQLKKYKLGTLYPNMVEFRPIIKHDDRITAIKYYHIKGSSWINLKPGDYIPVGSKISITTNLKSPYTIANVVSSSLTDIKVVPSAGGGNAYDILGYVTDKSPQKIAIDIQVDSSLVQWNPVVESNVPYKSVKYYKLVDTSFKAINVGDYVLVGQRILTQITTVGIEDEVVAAVSEQLDIYGINKNSNGEYNILGITSSTTPQNINITIDEYIRYEDIVQPYPVLLRFNDENGNEVSWGGKFKVGSTITRIGNIADPESNLLNGLYSISGLSLNGKAVTSSTSIVEKQMVFRTTATWLLDNNEPKVILSPRLLRIPNSSYKLLGYIPDISGHGNHGVIHNSAYSGDSGADGIKICNFYISNYLIDGKAIADKLNNTMSFLNDDSVSIIANPGEATVGGGKARVTGMKSNSRITFYASYPYLVITKDGIYDIPYADADATSIDLMSWSNCKGVTIESLGKYEGAYCLDGVDDFVTIPTTVGGKQVLMKVNWQKNDSMIYNQNPGEDNFAIFANDYNGSNVVKAYASRNNGSTYIDSILNNNILATQLKNVIHNITIANENVVDNTIVPVIGANAAHNNFYAQMALYDFMLFDNISTDDKIKELNEYVGIEAKVELPPYYWDNYGKTNLDEDKNYTANLGTVKDVTEAPAIFANGWYNGGASENEFTTPVVSQTDYTVELQSSYFNNNEGHAFKFNNDEPLSEFRARLTKLDDKNRRINLIYNYYINGKWNEIKVFDESNDDDEYIKAKTLVLPESEKSYFYGNGIPLPNILIEVLPPENPILYGLSNTNFAYDKMSGFGGYPFAKFDNTTEWFNNGATPMIVSRNGYSVTLKKVSGIEFWRFINKTLTTLDEQLIFKVRCNKAIKVIFQVKYFKNNSTDIGYNYNHKEVTLIPNEDTTIIVPPISVSDIPEATSILFIGVLFDNTSLSNNEEYTIEMLSLYPNGLVYDGVTDYSENVNIPAFTDYTYIFKRELLDASANTCSMYKGILTEGSKTAFVSDYDKNTEIGGRSFGNYIAVSSLRTNKIIYGTKASVNGDNIVPGNNVDALGLVLGKYYDSSYKKLVFYKLILYPKTIPLLQINFLKNLMERDEIIDLNNKIFIQE